MKGVIRGEGRRGEGRRDEGGGNTMHNFILSIAQRLPPPPLNLKSTIANLEIEFLCSSCWWSKTSEVVVPLLNVKSTIVNLEIEFLCSSC